MEKMRKRKISKIRTRKKGRKIILRCRVRETRNVALNNRKPVSLSVQERYMFSPKYLFILYSLTSVTPAPPLLNEEKITVHFVA
jgi:hypothetical protein